MGRIPALLLLVSSIPVLVLAVAALTGIGLHQNLSALQSLLVAATLALLPALGLASLFGAGTASHGGAMWGWSLAVLLTLPAYHPGQRESATAEGLLLITAPLGDRAALSIAEAGRGAIGWLGREAPRPQAAISIEEGRKLLVSEPMEAEQAPDEMHEAPSEPLAQQRERRRKPLPLAIPYEGDATSLRIPVAVDGPEYGEELTMIFDTGATLSTLNRHTLDLLEIPVPVDAPRIRLNTAAGEIEVDLVLADAVWLGNEAVEWVTIAVCEPCARDGVAGLLGLNVSGQFHVSIDHDSRLIELRPRGQRTNRKIDVAPWLHLRSQLAQWNDGRIEVEIEAHNRAHQEIRSAILEVECADERFAVRLYGIPAESSIRETASLARGSDCSQYRIHTFAADWLQNRF
ncbi:MAG: retropepsin-like domain-containing protein [Deltaproteobacteria bacterium]|nr:retropepsin-like domain-containing protein [Deltaproteobacteria bacterium]MBW2416914.1 retropepsin-like domain-containing protein [Deltaproteobacteria bacterium]